MLLGRYLPATGAIEDAPQRQIFSGGFVVVLYARSDKQHVACDKRFPLSAVDEGALAANEKIDLVLLMWCLAVWSHRDRKRQVERTAFQR